MSAGQSLKTVARPFSVALSDATTTGQSRRCSLASPWARGVQVTAAPANGEWELICSKGPNWLLVGFHAYYFEAVFPARLAGLLETSGNNDQKASFFREARYHSSPGSQGKAR